MQQQKPSAAKINKYLKKKKEGPFLNSSSSLAKSNMKFPESFPPMKPLHKEEAWAP